MSARWFSLAIVLLSFLAALFYGLEGDSRRCVYWLAAAVLNWAVVA